MRIEDIKKGVIMSRKKMGALAFVLIIAAGLSIAAGFSDVRASVSSTARPPRAFLSGVEQSVTTRPVDDNKGWFAKAGERLSEWWYGKKKLQDRGLLLKNVEMAENNISKTEEELSQETDPSKMVLLRQKLAVFTKFLKDNKAALIAALGTAAAAAYFRETDAEDADKAQASRTESMKRYSTGDVGGDQPPAEGLLRELGQGVGRVAGAASKLIPLRLVKSEEGQTPDEMLEGRVTFTPKQIENMKAGVKADFDDLVRRSNARPGSSDVNELYQQQQIIMEDIDRLAVPSLPEEVEGLQQKVSERQRQWLASGNLGLMPGEALEGGAQFTELQLNALGDKGKALREKLNTLAEGMRAQEGLIPSTAGSNQAGSVVKEKQMPENIPSEAGKRVPSFEEQRASAMRNPNQLKAAERREQQAIASRDTALENIKKAREAREEAELAARAEEKPVAQKESTALTGMLREQRQIMKDRPDVPVLPLQALKDWQPGERIVNPDETPYDVLEAGDVVKLTPSQHEDLGKKGQALRENLREFSGAMGDRVRKAQEASRDFARQQREEEAREAEDKLRISRKKSEQLSEQLQAIISGGLTSEKEETPETDTTRALSFKEYQAAAAKRRKQRDEASKKVPVEKIREAREARAEESGAQEEPTAPTGDSAAVEAGAEPVTGAETRAEAEEAPEK